MFARSRNAAVLAIALTCWLAPGTAGAASSASFDDPVGDTIYFAPDLGATTVTVGDDDTITLDTRIVPRPPAYWGGCGYTVGVFPYQTCVPADMNVTWYLDFASGAGSVADGGADAKVTAIPRGGQTFWESARWDTANGRFAAGAKPAGAEDSAGAGWKLNLADLGIPKPATARIWVVSLYKSYNGVGTLLNYSDVAGPGSINIGDVAAAGAAVRPLVHPRDRQGEQAPAPDPRSQAAGGEGEPFRAQATRAPALSAKARAQIDEAQVRSAREGHTADQRAARLPPGDQDSAQAGRNWHLCAVGAEAGSRGGVQQVGP